MNKKIIALTLAVITAFSTAIPGVAVENHDRTEGTTHAWGDLIDSLNPNDYSGVYVEDGTLHISATDEQKLRLVISKSRASESNIIVDPAEKYTYQQLLDAQEKLIKNYADFNINETFLDLINNSVVVRSSEWTDEKKLAVRELLSIDNLIFEIFDGKYDYDIDEENEIKSEGTTKDNPRQDDVVNGDLITKGNLAYSVGCGVVYNKSNPSKKGYGYITAAHGLSKSDTLKYNGEILGSVLQLSNSGPLDVAVVKEPSNPTLWQSEHLLGGQGATVTQSDSPVQGEVVYMYGFASYNQGVACPQVGYITLVNGTAIENGVVRTGFVEANYKRNSGDSGAPVIAIRNGLSTLVGIHSGAKHNGETALFVNFREIRNAYDLNLAY